MEGTYAAHRHICSCLDRCADSSPFTLFILLTVLHKNVFPGFAQLDIQRRLFLFSPFVTNPAASHSQTWCTLTKRLLAINVKWRVFIYISYFSHVLYVPAATASSTSTVSHTFIWYLVPADRETAEQSEILKCKCPNDVHQLASPLSQTPTDPWLNIK